MIVLYILAGIIVPFLFSCFVFFVYYYRQGMRIPPGAKQLKKRFFLLRIYVDFPQRLILDMFSREADSFPCSGLHLIVGEQGSGKTITLTRMLLDYKARYPKVKIRTNYGYSNEDGKIKSWKDLVFKNNGIYGEIDVIDEIQNWFNSLESRDFPVEMFSEITQQRKQRKMIIGTSQVWQRVAKPIREQVKLVYKPITVFGCLTIVRVYKPSVNDDGAIDKLAFRKMWFFVHDDIVRGAFDTYRKIQVMSLKGFKSDVERAAMFATAGNPTGLPEAQTSPPTALPARSRLRSGK